MGDKLDALLHQIKDLEKEVIRESRKKETEFCYKIHAAKIEFTVEARAQHRKLIKSLRRFLTESRFLALLTTPIIWMCLVPVLIVDLVGSIYQAICFPIYQIPKVRRRDYIAFDRHHLGYLNFIEKLNCEYCAYANGILAYFSEIAARTEQYWCPIRHARCVKCAHSRYKTFVDYGDGDRYRQQLEEIRQSYGDVDSPNAETKT
jgi:hypothetical protein